MSVPGDAPHNLLRPEAAEAQSFCDRCRFCLDQSATQWRQALWYMWYYTGDHKYRQWAGNWEPSQLSFAACAHPLPTETAIERGRDSNIFISDS